MDRKKLFKFIGSLIFLIFVLNFLANEFHWYYSIWYFDIIMHFLGGVWLGLVALWIFGSDSKFWKALFFVLVLGFGWEVFEFIFNNYLAQIPFNLADSLSDIFFDVLGGMCGILYLCKKQEIK